MQPTPGRRAASGSSPPPDQLAALIERFLTTGMTAAELAREFGMPVATVRAWLSHAAEAVTGPAGAVPPDPVGPLPWEMPDFEPEVARSEPERKRPARNGGSERPTRARNGSSERPSLTRNGGSRAGAAAPTRGLPSCPTDRRPKPADAPPHQTETPKPARSSAPISSAKAKSAATQRPAVTPKPVAQPRKAAASTPPVQPKKATTLTPAVHPKEASTPQPAAKAKEQATPHRVGPAKAPAAVDGAIASKKVATPKAALGAKRTATPKAALGAKRTATPKRVLPTKQAPAFEGAVVPNAVAEPARRSAKRPMTPSQPAGARKAVDEAAPPETQHWAVPRSSHREQQEATVVERGADETRPVDEMSMKRIAASDLAPGGVAEVEDMTLRAETLDAAAASIANGASMASVAQWFNVPESELEGWIKARVERAAADLLEPLVGAGAEVLPPEVPTAPDAASVQGSEVDAVSAPLRSDEADVDAAAHAVLNAEDESAVVAGEAEAGVVVEPGPGVAEQSFADLPVAGAEGGSDPARDVRPLPSYEPPPPVEAPPAIEQLLQISAALGVAAAAVVDAAPASVAGLGDTALPPRVLEIAGGSIANGSSPDSALPPRWCNLPDSRLEEWITMPVEQVAVHLAGPLGNGHADRALPDAQPFDVSADESVKTEAEQAMVPPTRAVPPLEAQLVESSTGGGEPVAGPAGCRVDPDAETHDGAPQGTKSSSPEEVLSPRTYVSAPVEVDRADAQNASSAQIVEAPDSRSAASIANGASMASAAQWFNVPESQLEEWIKARVERAAADLLAPPVGAGTEVMPPEVLTASDAASVQGSDVDAVSAALRSVETDVDADAHAVLNAEDESAVEKVAKLLNKAERASTPEEAEAFFAKAFQLQTKYALDEAIIQAKRTGSVKPEEIIEKCLPLVAGGAETGVVFEAGPGGVAAAAVVDAAPASVAGLGDAALPPRVLEIAGGSIANGSSPDSALPPRWCNLPDSRLEEWITMPVEQVAADLAEPLGNGHADRALPDAQPFEVSADEAVKTEAEQAMVPPTRAVPPVETSGREHRAESTGASLPTASRSRFVTTVHSSNRTAGAGALSRPLSLMSPRDFFQVLRRRLLIVIAAIALGSAAGWMTAPGEAAARETNFRATHTLIYEPELSPVGIAAGYNVEQVAVLATSGEVPSRVAARLKLDRHEVRSSLSAVADTKVSTISITGLSPDPVRAALLADTTAEELIADFGGKTEQANYEAELARLTTGVETARKRFNEAKGAAALAAARNEVTAAETALQQFPAKPPKSHLFTLEAATATAVEPEGVQVPNSNAGRALLLGGLGLLFGVAGALALNRFDTRIQSKPSAEEAFGAPVVAEVPPISKPAGGQLLTRTQPSSPVVEAYRALRTYVALWAMPDASRDDGHRVIVVTSPGAGEGKTTTVAHLAAMLAEIGRSVVIVSADLRRPRLHQYFDVAEAPGLADALGAETGPVFDGLDRPTSVHGVRLIPSGPAVENPASLIEHAEELLGSLRGLAEFVLVDSPPLLVASDAIELSRYADGVLLVARAGKTPIEAAARSKELLERLEIPVVGSVLVASNDASRASRYYSSRYYREPERTGWLWRRSASSNGHRPPTETEPLTAPEEASSTLTRP